MNKTMNFRIRILFLLFLATFLLSFSVGRYAIHPIELLQILVDRLFHLTSNLQSNTEIIVFQIRLPRILGATLIGMALSLSGSIYQGIFHNPLVSPDLLGSSAGSGFGAAIALLLGSSQLFIHTSAFLLGGFAVLLSATIASHYKNSPPLGLILSGIMISSLFSAATSYVKLIADPTDQLPAITYWLMGSLSSIRLSHLGPLVLLIGSCSLFLLLIRWRLNLLSLNDEEARSLGIETKKFRLLIIVLTTLMTSTCVAFSGLISWVGLVIPHFARKLVGSDFRYQLPASLFLGATFMILVDNVARTLALVEIPIGILTAFIGAPFFLWMILKGGHE